MVVHQWWRYGFSKRVVRAKNPILVAFVQSVMSGATDLFPYSLGKILALLENENLASAVSNINGDKYLEQRSQ